jgi:hypothetical protein
MFLLALGAQGPARWDGAGRERKAREANSKGYQGEKLSQEAQHFEGNASIENGSADLHRHVDTKSFVFAEKKALSTRAVASPSRKRLAAYAS